ncbi:MAG: DNA primase [Kofleriaceae bacterium]|nr:DNA primase [Myxococcales bacterium]MCB9564590.1 DNA primase [Kofleriaceae bacterium]
MALIPDDTIAEIRTKADIVAIIGQHVQLRKAGRNWKGLCPFHGEKTPSFNVSPDKGFFYCFGCQKKGDAFTFVMEYEGKSFHEAAETLAALTGVTLPIVEDSPALRRARSERAQMLEVNKIAAAFFRDVLGDPARGAAGRAYLDGRRIDAAQEERFQLGYAPGDWHALADHLAAQRVDLEIAVKVGLIVRQPRAGGFYDRFRDRLVCPVIVPGGEVVGFSARIVGDAVGRDGTPVAKYINSPESAVYKKSKLLYGLAQARESFRSKGRAVLVEGNFDVISMHQAGFTETVAPLGTALTTEQVEQLRRLADRVVLFYDGDRAGYQATVSALSMFLAAELPAHIATAPGRAGGGGAGMLRDGADPDSLASGGADSHERLAEMIGRARPGLEFLAYEVWPLARTPEQRARAVDDAAKLLAKVANPTERDLITGTLATAMQLDPGVVQRALARATGRSGAGAGPSSGRGYAHPNAPGGDASAGHSSDRGGAPVPDGPPPPTEELDLLALLADHPGLGATSEESGVLSLLTDERLRDMYSASRAGQSLVELAPQRLSTPSAQAVLSARFAKHPDPARLLDQMVANLRLRQGRLETAELQRRLADAQRRGDTDLARRLASQIVTTRKQVD